jgi:hypothetical protein
MSPRSRLPGQQGRQCGFADSAFAAERNFHDVSLTARPNGRNRRTFHHRDHRGHGEEAHQRLWVKKQGG